MDEAEQYSGREKDQHNRQHAHQNEQGGHELLE
jgi:hypothetical protein